MKLKFLMLIFSFLILTACGVTKPVATTHTERIETHLQPIHIGADTIEIELCRDTRSECPDGTRSVNSVSSVDSVRNKNSSVREKENSVRNKNPVRISSTRGVNISRHETDTTSMLRITLRPDTVFVPYTHHIRSDTIVVPDRVCQQKLNHSNMTNLFLILILIAMLMLAVRRAKLV